MSRFKLLRDILHDKDNGHKYSMPRTFAFISMLLFIVSIIVGLHISIDAGKLDHVLVMELLFFILTILGFKSKFGFGNSTFETESKKNSEDVKSDEIKPSE